MLNSTVLDVAIGVVFSFLAASLFASAAVEAINSILKLRSRSLVSGIKALVNDPEFTGLARTLYQHAAISPRGPGDGTPLKRYPSYIDAKQFAAAILDITGLSAASTGGAAQAPGPQAVLALKAQLTGTDDRQLRQLLEGIIDRSRGDLQQIQTEIASWFDSGMDRVSGAFKRWTQLATFMAALLIAVLANIDTVRLATVLWEQPMLAEQLKMPNTPPSTGTDRPTTGEDVRSALTSLQAGLPVGWAPGHFMETSDGHGGWRSLRQFPLLLSSLTGWIITAIAALFGGPFWFDALQSFVRLKGSGPSPAEKAGGRAAAQ